MSKKLFQKNFVIFSVYSVLVTIEIKEYSNTVVVFFALHLATSKTLANTFYTKSYLASVSGCGYMEK